MRILAVTSWGGACGIANYAEMAIAAITAADPTIHIDPFPKGLDPVWVTDYLAEAPIGVEPPDVIWLNYHRGLHSRWTPRHVAELQAQGAKVLVTWHDTYGEAEPDALTQDFHDVADAFVVHEPCVGLPKAVEIRQGVPAAQVGYEFGRRAWAEGLPDDTCFKDYLHQPVLGTCGFNFPWKNFTALAKLTADAGWALFIASNNATDEDVAEWLDLNPNTGVLRGYQPTSTIVSRLTGCDATAFPYTCANSGTSGAIRLGLAARKPVFALEGCRQMRDLWAEGSTAITWGRDLDVLAWQLDYLQPASCAPAVVRLAAKDSWANQGLRYAGLFQSLATRSRL